MNNFWIDQICARATEHVRLAVELVLALISAVVAVPLFDRTAESEKTLLDYNLGHEVVRSRGPNEQGKRQQEAVRLSAGLALAFRQKNNSTLADLFLT